MAASEQLSCKPISLLNQPRWPIAAGIFAVALFLTHLGIVLFVRSVDLQKVLGDFINPLGNLAATAALFFAARSSMRQSRHFGRAWLVIAIAQLINTTADILYTIMDVGLHNVPYPSIADFFYVAYYPALFIGVRLIVEVKNGWYDSLITFIDTSIVMGASLLVFLVFLLGPLFAAGAGSSPLAQVLSLAYPIGDLIVVWALITLLFHAPWQQSRGPLVFLALCMILMVLADCLYSYQMETDSYLGGLVDVGWTASYGLALIAGVWQGFAARRPLAPLRSSEVSRFAQAVQSGLKYAVYCLAIGAYVILLASHSAELYISFQVMGIWVGIIIALVIVRQIVVMVENERLAASLRSALERVQEQASSVETTNQELQIEIAERKRAEEQLVFDALHDDLTGLPNRALFLDRLSWAMEYTRRRQDVHFSVLFMDLDSFKVINDSLGHTTGDELLKAIAERLKKCLRSSDTVARLGGDEFVLLVESTPESNQVARRILADLALPFEISSLTITTSASIGVVTDLHDYTHAEDVLRDADIAMYHAKALGKSRFEIFDTLLRDRAVSRLEMENDLRRGLAAGNEFVLYYQPILSLQPKRIFGFEALLRWNHPQKGMLLPGEFISLAEETGLIMPLGHWVMATACRQIREWHEIYAMDPPLSMSVNISSRQFNRPGFVDEVAEILRETGIDGPSLKLELTESVCLDGSDAALHIFNSLNALGVCSEIDDFGTGYSALGYLQRFPIHTIKIDRTFIQRIGVYGINQNLVRTIVALAQNLGMDAVAEGIETEEQLEQLRSLGCIYGQGYLFSHPLAASAAGQLIQDQCQA